MSRLSRFVAGDLQTMMAGNVLESGMRFAAYVIYSRQLGPSNLGLVASVSSLVYLMTEMTNLGIDASVISLGSKDFGQGERQRLARLCQSGLCLHLTLGIAVAIVGCLAAPALARAYFLDPTIAQALVVVFAGSVVYRIAEYALSVLRTYQRFRFHAAAGMSGATTLFLGAVVLAATGRVGVVSVLALVFLAAPLTVLAVALAGTPRECLVLRAANVRRAGELLAFGKWIWATNMLESLVRRSSVLLLQAFAGSTVTGHFTLASRYAEALSLVFDPLRKYLLPKFTELADREALARMMRRTYRPLAWTLLLIPASWAVAGPAITWAQGAGWEPAVGLFRILVVARLLFLLTKPMTFVLLSLQKPWLQALVHVPAALVFFACARTLIPQYGAVGSAIALLVFSVIVLVSLVYCLRREWARPTAA